MPPPLASILALLVLGPFVLDARAALAAPPGGLTGHRFVYADSWRGWPVAPVHRQHPVRGSFNDPRFPARDYHWGIDINVRDDRPAPGAPPGRTHRVYAVEGGVVESVRDSSGTPCLQRRLFIGHFSYWHVDATVRRGQRVRPGQPIGWTCEGAWHLHLGEQAVVGGRPVWVNPLHRGGKLRPYVDSASPVIHDLGLYTPAMPPEQGRRLDPDRLRGSVDLRAWVGDPQSFRGWMVGAMAPLLTDHHPYELRVRLTRLADRRAWSWTAFRADVWFGSQLPSAGTPIPFSHHFAPATTSNIKLPACLRRLKRAEDGTTPSCMGQFRFRLFATRDRLYWNTQRFANGEYRVRVTARDVAGNTASATAKVTIAN